MLVGVVKLDPVIQMCCFSIFVFFADFRFFSAIREIGSQFFLSVFFGGLGFFSVFFRIFSDFFSDYFQIFLARFFGQIFLKSTKLKLRFWGSGDVIEFATEILVWCSAN